MLFEACVQPGLALPSKEPLPHGGMGLLRNWGALVSGGAQGEEVSVQETTCC